MPAFLAAGSEAHAHSSRATRRRHPPRLPRVNRQVFRRQYPPGFSLPQSRPRCRAPSHRRPAPTHRSRAVTWPVRCARWQVHSLRTRTRAVPLQQDGLFSILVVSRFRSFSIIVADRKKVVGMRLVHHFDESGKSIRSTHFRQPARHRFGQEGAPRRTKKVRTKLKPP